MTLDDLIVEFLVLLGQGFTLGFEHEHNRGGFLGLGGHSQFHAAADEDVGDAPILTEDGDVADDIDGGDIGGQDDYSLGALLDGLDHILHSSLEVLLAVEMAGQFEDLAAEGVVGQGGGDGRVVEGLGVFCLHWC